MKSVFPVLLAFLTFTIFYACEREPALPPDCYVGGIQINEVNQNRWAETLKEAGMNLTQVTAYAKQGNWNSDHLWWEDSDTIHIIEEIRASKRQGLSVIMVLRVALQHEHPLNKFKWHGMIYPSDEAQRVEWFYRYKYFVEMWARICEHEGVDIFAIGSEMNALTASRQLDTLPALLEYFSNVEKQRNYLGRIFKYKDKLQEEDLWVRGIGNYTSQERYIEDKIAEQKKWADIICHAEEEDPIKVMNRERSYLDSTWHDIIANARQHYSGKMTLAANFDNYHEVSFWDSLDFIGINAYFPLREIAKERLEEDILEEELRTGWDSVFTQIKRFQKENKLEDKELFFTEIGYTAKADCTAHPWQGDGFNLLTRGKEDTLIIWNHAENRPEERTAAMRALRDIIQRDSIALKGLCWWKLTTHIYHLGYEPFMLYIAEDPVDSLQVELSRFNIKKPKQADTSEVLTPDTLNI